MLFNFFSKTFGFNAYLFLPFLLALLKPAATGRATNWRVFLTENFSVLPSKHCIAVCPQ